MIATKRPNGRTKPAEAVPETAVRALVRAFGLLERVQQPYWSSFGISGSQWGVLRALYRAETESAASHTSGSAGGLRLTDLSERLLIRPPSVTGVVDRLQRAGLVVRGGSRTDLRVKQVGLTPDGRQLVKRVLAVHSDQVSAVLGGLEPDEQAELHRLLARL